MSNWKPLQHYSTEYQYRPEYQLFPTNPSLGDELTRLFVRGRGRLSSTGSSHGSTDIITADEDVDDFSRNGIDTELDDLDKLVRNMDTLTLSLRESESPSRSRIMPRESNNVISDNGVVSLSTMMAFLQARGDSTTSESTSPRSPTPAFSNQAQRRRYKTSASVCVFCRNNGERKNVYESHVLKENGRVTCPILRKYTCPLCGANGDHAHTIKYCPLSAADTPNVTRSLKTARTSTGKKRHL